MKSRCILVVLFCLLLPLGQVFAKGRKAVETRPEHVEIIQRGIASHDAGKYAEAIAEYAKVLAENPDDVLAIYETAFSYSAQKNWKQCQEWAERGLGYDGPSNTRLRNFVILGTCEDESGGGDKAVKTYKRGLKEFRNSAPLHYNLGVTYQRLGKMKEARQSLQEALRVDPLHISSHLLLGQVYLQSNYRVPGILALSRYLILEPAAPRSANAAKWILNAVQAGVQSTEPGKVNVTLFMPDKKASDEGDFQSAETMLSLLVAGFHADEMKNKPPHEKLDMAFGSLFENVVPESGKLSGFAQQFYGPYFAELDKKEFTPVFLRFAIRNLSGVDDIAWIEANREKIREFLAWSEAYSWKQR